MREPTPPTSHQPPTLPTDYWRRLGVRIAFAGGVFPVLLSVPVWLGVGLAMLVSGLMQGDFVLTVMPLLFSLTAPLFYWPVMFATAFVYAAVITIGALPIIAGSVRLMNLRVAKDSLGGTSGGLIAWIAVAPPVIAVIDDASAAGPFWVVSCAVLGGLAICHGMVCGSMVGLRALRRRRRKPRPPTRSGPRMQLSLRAVLGAVVPLSIVMATISSLELPVLGVGLHASLGAACLAGLSRPMRWTANRWLDFRQRRRRRKRRERRALARPAALPTDRST